MAAISNDVSPLTSMGLISKYIFGSRGLTIVNSYTVMLILEQSHNSEFQHSNSVFSSPIPFPIQITVC